MHPARLLLLLLLLVLPVRPLLPLQVLPHLRGSLPQHLRLPVLVHLRRKQRHQYQKQDLIPPDRLVAAVAAVVAEAQVEEPF